jgi:uncharacterized membrane protein
MICAVLAADYAITIFDRLRGLRGRYLLAAFTGVALFLSAGLTLWRETVSDYQAYSKTDIEAAAFIEENTSAHAVFLTGYQYHINPVSSLAGRTIVCGPDTWLYYHGFDTTERKNDIERFYADPNGNLDVLAKYKVEYILLSSNERSNMPVDYEGLEKLFPLFYTGENGEISLYEVPPEYRAVPEG